MPPKKKVSLADKLKEFQAKSETHVGPIAEGSRKVEGFSTGNIALDYLTGVGGFPKGRIVEMFGARSSGKSTSALQAMALAQQQCIEDGEGYVLFADYEKTLDPDYCLNLGLDTTHDTFVYLAPNTFEEGANMYRELLATGELRYSVFDSVAAMITEKESEDLTGKVTVADRARALHQFCRQITPVLARYNSTAVFLNHVTDVIDPFMASKGIKMTTRPGGKALDFYASLAIEFKQKKHYKTKRYDPLTGSTDAEVVSSTGIEAKLVKNKVGDPQGVAELRVRFGKGFSQTFSVVQILIGSGFIERKSTGMHYVPTPDGNTLTFRSEEKAYAGIESDPDLLKFLEAKAWEVLRSHGKSAMVVSTDAESTDEADEELDDSLGKD